MRTDHSHLIAQYRIVTPLFCGGAEQQAEFRLPSFKGLLRFWWRALEWSRIQDLKQLREEEAALFGSSDEGQSRFLMRVTQQSLGALACRPEQLKDGGQLVGEGARYLGYGAMEAYASKTKGTKDAQLTRSCRLAPSCFDLELRFGSLSRTSAPQQLQIGRALKLAGQLGGIGSKSRKGYGSLTLIRLTNEDGSVWHAPHSASEYATALQQLLGGSVGQASGDWSSLPVTAFSRDSRMLLIQGRKGESALNLLDRIGREMVRYRSWGRDGKVLKTIPREDGDEFRFRDDHDLMRIHPTPAKLRDTHPHRIAFGLPHNYGQKRQDQVSAADPKLDRRASPLFIHIHETEASPPLGVLSFLPSMFLPAGRDRISVGGKEVPLQTQGLWQPVTGFLNRLLDPSARQEFDSSDRIEEVQVPHG